MPVTDHPRKFKAQSGATKAMLMLLNTIAISHNPEKHVQIGDQHLIWEGCSHTSRHTGLLQASILSVHSSLFAIEHRCTGVQQSISALCSSVGTPVLTLFQICGLKVPGKYKLLYSKAQKLFFSTKCSYLFLHHEDKAQG